MEELKTKSQAVKGTADSIQAMGFLKRVSALKALSERKVQAVSDLESTTACRMSAYDVLMLMFNSVLKSMYHEDWKTSTEESTGPACPVSDELSLATTI